ncbi:MAG: hypothetical protein COA71_14380 [SAR86 cluster bacterium]|uniref:DUF427 domain-containing protein n=1 Tax=SAR86 cluster bacterium TaxID=2030880 RepID=A0A2A5C661_9GAMM|nr:MAG: hypothetical protein COA71_14380 [SAR86 cluster bacterium]
MSESIHYTVLKDINGRVTVTLNSIVLAESGAVISLSEVYKNKEYPSVMYFPRAGVNMALFSKVEGFHTSCPIKGSASYYTLEVDGEEVENAAWSYENPLQENAKIKGYIAFDLTKFNPSITRK